MARNIIAILGLALMLGGCGVALQPVSTRVDSVQIDEQTDEGVRLLVTVIAENPNDIPLPIVRAKYQVELPGAGVETFKFTDLPMATMPAKGKQTITLPAAIAMSGGNATGQQVKVNGQLTYEPAGEIRKLMTEYGVPLPSSGFRSQGELP